MEYSKQAGDFRIDGKWTIEIGGSDKTYDQFSGPFSLDSFSLIISYNKQFSRVKVCCFFLWQNQKEFTIKS